MSFTGPIRSGQPSAIVRWSDAGSYRAAVSRPPIRSIVVTKLDHIGDFILGFDAMIALREGFPGARIDLICAPWNEALAQSTGLFDRVLTLAFFDKRSDGEHPRFDLARMRHLRDESWDLAIDLRADDDTRVVLRHLDAVYRVGFESDQHNEAMTIAIPHRLPRNYETNIGMHQTFLMLRLVRATIDLFHRDDSVRTLLLERLAQPAEDIDLSRANGRFLVVCNTSSGRAAKNWPIDRFMRLVGWLANDLGATVVLLGGKDQLEESSEIIARYGAANIISAVGRTTIGQAATIIAQASLFIGNDSGLTHIAARLDIPTLALFSSIDPTSTWAPLGENVTVLKSPVPCAPCHISLLSDCRGNHACLTNITEPAVRSAARRLLARARRFGDPAAARPARAPNAFRGDYVAIARRNLRVASADPREPAMAEPQPAVPERFRSLARAFELLSKEALVADLAEIGTFKDESREILSRFASQMQVALRVLGPDDIRAIPDDARFCLVHIDCPRYQEVMDALDALYPRMIPGGFVIVQNYFSTHWDGVARAVDAFLANRPECIVPTGDGAGAAMIRRFKTEMASERPAPVSLIESAPAW